MTENQAGGFQLSEVRKTLITALGMIIAVGTFIISTATDLLPAGWGEIIASVIGVLTIVLNYLAPNETDTASRALNRSVRLRRKPRKAKAAAAATRPPRAARRPRRKRSRVVQAVATPDGPRHAAEDDPAG